MNIAEMQKAILDAGWQFNEHVFNDGIIQDCYVQFSKSKNVHVFSLYVTDEQTVEDRKGVLGWGRFIRQYAWDMAYNVIILGGEHDPKLSNT